MAFELMEVEQPWRTIGNKVTFRYSDYFERVFLYSTGEYGVDVFSREFFDDTWYQWQKSFSTSFGIEQVVGRTSEEYVIGGYDEQTGETVFELWKFQTPDGSYQSRRLPEGIIPVGTEAPLTQADVDLVGSIFIPPAERVVVSPPIRKVLYRGDGVRIREFVVDPDGRYLVVLDDVTDNLVQISNGEINLIGDSEIVPLLEGALEPRYYQHGTYDRILFFMTMTAYPHQVLLVHDFENDGVIDFVGGVDQTEFMDSFPQTWSSAGGQPDYLLVR